VTINIDINIKSSIIKPFYYPSETTQIKATFRKGSMFGSVETGYLYPVKLLFTDIDASSVPSTKIACLCSSLLR